MTALQKYLIIFYISCLNPSAPSSSKWPSEPIESSQLESFLDSTKIFENLTKKNGHPTRKRRTFQKNDDYDHEELRAYLNECNTTIDLWPGKIVTLMSPFYTRKSLQYPSNINCHWEIVGTMGCRPEVSCEVNDLRKIGDSCEAEYLKISDGLATGHTVCGHGPHVIGLGQPMKTKVGNYIYIDFETANHTYDRQFDRFYKGFECTVRCNRTKNQVNVALMPDLEPEEFKCVCGVQRRPEDGRIVNGKTAKKHEFPWQVALVSPGTRKPFCGGTLINSRFILTASHCFFISGKSQMKSVEVILRGHILEPTLKGDVRDVPLGEPGSLRSPGYNLTDDPTDEIQLQVDTISIHRFYSKFAEYDYDVALLRLAKPIDLQQPDSPVPVCLPSLEDIDKDLTGQQAMVAGWGLAHENAGSTTKILQKLKLPILELETCRSLYDGYDITSNMMCAGFAEGKKDACQGDSGGPLTIQNEKSQWTQVGIVSWGEGCARKDKPGVYSLVSKFLPWILHRARGATWCVRSVKR